MARHTVKTNAIAAQQIRLQSSEQFLLLPKPAFGKQINLQIPFVSQLIQGFCGKIVPKQSLGTR